MASDNLLAGLTGLLEGVSSVYVPYQKENYDLQRQMRLKQLLMPAELAQKQKEADIQSAANIATFKGESGTRIEEKNREMEATKAHDSMFGSEFTEIAQRTLGLKPDVKYRVSDVEKAMTYKATSLAHPPKTTDMVNMIDPHTNHPVKGKPGEQMDANGFLLVPKSSIKGQAPTFAGMISNLGQGLDSLVTPWGRNAQAGAPTAPAPQTSQQKSYGSADDILKDFGHLGVGNSGF